MTTGILLLAHEPLATSLLRIAVNVLGRCPPGVETFDVVNDAPCEILLTAALEAVERLDTGQGVLVLTDLFGATPANLATRLLERRAGVRVIAGVNLPMLLRALNYATLDLDTIAAKALEGGQAGVRCCLSGDLDG